MTSVPKPRLCRLRKRDPTEEFGFNLHAEKNRGHFVGAVDKNGIGERAGLQMGQRIVGVNGQLIYPSTAHKEVVSLIKKNPLRTELLVASEEIDQWYTENHMEYSFGRVDLYNFENGSSPTNEVKMFGEQFIDSNVSSSKFHYKLICQDIVAEKNVSPNSKTKITASVAPLKQEADLLHQDEAEKFERNDKMDKNGIPDIFKLSAGEARSRLVSRKKDPRRDSQMSLKEKYKLVSNM
ncbi:PDZ/DHR/GLGF domain protein [Onchocerca flexuosa]|uniref:PDZ/DHR/GLGF domain protein n=1 Tax=Onchocerca flexuosa TaxID=387005 RepID=A0A238BHL9_9BILA|nr:PDZ/DHR/GLGF domain protein [Onchocerca flexuosa]